MRKFTSPIQAKRKVDAKVKESGDITDILFSHSTPAINDLEDRRYRSSNSKARQEILGNHETALTVVIAEIYDEEWLVEVEVIAMP